MVHRTGLQDTNMASQMVKDIVEKTIDKNSNDLNDLSKSIWEHPELGFQETHAHDLLTKFLEKRGFQVERRYKLDTAFRAVFGQEGTGPNVAVLCEYDALPEIGHACGHNLISEAGVGAGLGIKAALQDGGIPGTVTVLGTPAEEGGGGKIDLLRAKAFENIDVAMMAHPTPFSRAKFACLSRVECRIKFHGKASHAAGFPWDGINALDAAVLCYQNISCLRQQMKPAWRVHGIIVNGGAKPNIIPELSELEYYLRAPTDAEVAVIVQKVTCCIEAAAAATGSQAEYEFDPKSYSNMITNNVLAEAFELNAKSVGVVFDNEGESKDVASGSTDMGNVSHVIPSIHPIYFVGTHGCVNHTRSFTEASGSPAAQKPTLDISKALALTAVGVLSSSEMLAKVKAEFQMSKVQ